MHLKGKTLRTYIYGLSVLHKRPSVNRTVLSANSEMRTGTKIFRASVRNVVDQDPSAAGFVSGLRRLS